jgi:hypothetical protein
LTARLTARFSKLLTPTSSSTTTTTSASVKTRALPRAFEGREILFGILRHIFSDPWENRIVS